MPDRAVPAAEWERLGFLLGDQQNRLHDLWETLSTPVYRVLDDEGDNVGQAEARRLPAGGWVYVDDLDGYQTFTDDEMADANMEEVS